MTKHEPLLALAGTVIALAIGCAPPAPSPAGPAHPVSTAAEVSASTASATAPASSSSDTAAPEPDRAGASADPAAAGAGASPAPGQGWKSCAAGQTFRCEQASSGVQSPSPDVCGCMGQCPRDLNAIIQAMGGTWPDGSLKGEMICSKDKVPSAPPGGGR